MRPRLRDDVHFLPSPQGVAVLAGERSLVLPAAAHPWLERIRPYLDGHHELDELVAPLAPAQRSSVVSLVTLLHRETYVRDAADDLPHQLSPAVRREHARLIAFIGLGADSPEYRFQAYRECAPVVVGAGRLFAAVTTALLASGVRRLWVSPTTGGSPAVVTDLDRLRACVAPLLARDPESRVDQLLDEPDDVTELGSRLVLYACDAPDRAQAQRLRARAQRAGIAFGSVVVDGDRAVVSPVAVPVAGERADVPDVPDVRSGPVSRYLGGPTAALAANQLCLHALRQFAGLDEVDTSGGTGARSTRVVLDLLSASRVEDDSERGAGVPQEAVR